jgi:acyl dehydratase
MLDLNKVKVGDNFSEEVVDNLTRTQIVQYAGVSGDYNPIHTDEVFAKEVVGYPSVFAHGMLTMGLTGKMLTNLLGDGNLKKFGVRFTNQVWPGDSLTTKATVTEINKGSDKTLISLEVTTENQNKIVVLTGSATASIS